MFATDFLFDGQRASDLGLMICSFNGDFETTSGGEIEYNVVKTPGRDKFTFYGSQFNSVITWNFSICKNPCKNDSMYFSRYEESMVSKWLVKTDGYRLIQFEQNGSEDIFYNVYINMLPHQISGMTVGFDLTVTSDCAYGFTDIIKRKATIGASTPLKLNVHSDINTYIFPIVKIKTFTGGHYIKTSFNNYKDDLRENPILHKPIIFTMPDINITMDSNTEIITGLSNPDYFNWVFLKLIDGNNFIATDFDSEVYDIDIEIQYREPRYVRI